MHKYKIILKKTLIFPVNPRLFIMLQNYNIPKKSQLNWQKLQVNDFKNDIFERFKF